jgi:hypothetical protein
MITEQKAEEMVKNATVQIRKQLAGKKNVNKTGIVRCNNFRCLGILGRDGIWKDSGGHPLEVIEVVSEF